MHHKEKYSTSVLFHSNTILANFQFSWVVDSGACLALGVAGPDTIFLSSPGNRVLVYFLSNSSQLCCTK